jgi:hypothetical protein
VTGVLYIDEWKSRDGQMKFTPKVDVSYVAFLPRSQVDTLMEVDDGAPGNYSSSAPATPVPRFAQSSFGAQPSSSGSSNTNWSKQKYNANVGSSSSHSSYVSRKTSASASIFPSGTPASGNSKLVSKSSIGDSLNCHPAKKRKYGNGIVLSDSEDDKDTEPILSRKKEISAAIIVDKRKKSSDPSDDSYFLCDKNGCPSDFTGPCTKKCCRNGESYCYAHVEGPHGKVFMNEIS